MLIVVKRFLSINGKINSVKKGIFISLVILASLLIGLRFAYQPLTTMLNLQPKAGVRIQSTPSAEVLINGQSVGRTPYQQEDLIEGEHLVQLKTDKADWQGYVQLSPGTLTVVNREISEKEATSSGEIIALSRGKGVMVVSSPQEAEVEVDGKYYGKSPILIEDLSVGEHIFLISRNNFLKRSIRAVVAEGYRLELIVDLAVSEADLTQVNTTPIQSTPKVIVKNTPVGFLRVRERATTSSNEIARVSEGEVLTVLEEIPNWVRVRLPDGKEGYVSSTYVQKQ